MKTRMLIPLLLIAMVAAFSPTLAAQATDWKQIHIPPLPAFHPQEPKRIELSNGMVIFLQEDHELPLIDGIARIRGGARSVPADKTGLMDIYGETWRTGGTKTETGDQLDDYLEIRAAKVETDSNDDSTSISLSCLKGDFDDVFKVFVDVLRNPEFRADKIDIARKGEYDAISRRNDEPDDIASRVSEDLAYGKDNPYARDPEYATVAAITRQDLINWHDEHVHPNDIILGLVGDFDSATMEAKLRQAFGSWQRGPNVKAPNIEFHPPKPGYYLAQKSDINQSLIRMVELGIRRDNPDFYAAVVFNEAFGGGFSSRLFKSIRTAQGLAYEVGGGIGSAFDHPGIEDFEVGTKSATTVEAIKAIYQQMDKLKTDPISESEIKLAKDSILNSFVFDYDTPEKVLRERMAYEFYGYPPDFLERFRAGIEKVTVGDVARIVPKYVHKDDLRVLVVGNPSGFVQPLTTLGAVNNVDLSIPPPPGAEKSETGKPSASNPQGKMLAGKVLAALGGEAQVNSIKSLRSSFKSTRNTPQGEMQMTVQATIVFPDHMHVAARGPMGAFTIVATPEAAFMNAPGMGIRDLPSSQKTELLAQIKRDLVYIGQHVNDPVFSFEAAGTEKVGDTEASVVNVNGPGVTVRWYVDPETGRVLSESYQTMGPEGPYQATTDFANWKSSGGLTLPYLHIQKQDGKQVSQAEFTSVELNPTVDPKLFDKPEVQAKSSQ